MYIYNYNEYLYICMYIYNYNEYLYICIYIYIILYIYIIILIHICLTDHGKVGRSDSSHPGRWDSQRIEEDPGGKMPWHDSMGLSAP